MSSNYIQISNLDNNTFWKKQLTSDEFQQVRDYVKGKEAISIIPATLIPVRTNSLINFTKDFFLPTTINHAIKVQNIVGKVFAILGALILDGLTFPVRILATIPRVISNAKQDENLLRKYLTRQNVDKKLLESDHVRVRLEWEKKSEFPTSIWTENGVEHREHSMEKHWSEENVNFIEVPVYENHDHFISGINS